MTEWRWDQCDIEIKTRKWVSWEPAGWVLSEKANWRYCIFMSVCVSARVCVRVSECVLRSKYLFTSMHPSFLWIVVTVPHEANANYTLHVLVSDTLTETEHTHRLKITLTCVGLQSRKRKTSYSCMCVLYSRDIRWSTCLAIQFHSCWNMSIFLSKVILPWNFLVVKALP